MKVAQTPRQLLSKHARAVANSLRMADEAAERRAYGEALSWLGMLQAIGETLPDGYQHKREAWLGAITSSARQGVASPGADARERP